MNYIPHGFIFARSNNTRRVSMAAAFYLFMGMGTTHAIFHRVLCGYRIFYKHQSLLRLKVIHCKSVFTEFERPQKGLE